MNILGSFILILAGTLAASAYIISKRPQAEHLIHKLVPFSGWIGIITFFWGVWYLLDLIANLGMQTQYIKLDPFWGFVSILFVPFIATMVGFMLGFVLVARWIPGQGRSEEKLLALRKKLIRLTTPLGLLAILAAVLHLFKILF